MAGLSAQPDQPLPGEGRSGEYVVVARRYRPQSFEELIGQEHVARALSNAITANRVGHAYLFTGARGVGKTSAARILAKALDCQSGPTSKPCNRCDVCLSIGAGSDVDVLEIDGASNRGIDEIRQLRQNVNIRPSRARFKVYIIDEVHMLTKEAFNALLKTLEEPPEHVKFIFCTTEANKIPITILSRCQRFDFAGIRSPSIVERLRQIVEAEGVVAEPAALDILARRANGSMRDSQSLLEQLLSFGGKHITATDVHALLGTAGDARLVQLIQGLTARDAAAALSELDGALSEGVDVGQLLEQLLGMYRDCMAAAAGCGPESFLYTSADEQQSIVGISRQLGLESILAAIQILDHTLGRLRFSTQIRTLAEMALVRIANLENLDQLPELIAQLRGEAADGGDGRALLSAPTANTTSPGTLHSPQSKKKDELTPASDGRTPVGPSPTVAQPLTAESAPRLWSQAVESLSGLLSESASHYAQLAIRAPNRLVVSFRKNYNFQKSFCERPDQASQLEKVLAELTGGPVRLEFSLLEEGEAAAAEPVVPPRRAVSQRQRLLEKSEHPLVRRAMELFDAQAVRIEEPES